MLSTMMFRAEEDTWVHSPVLTHSVSKLRQDVLPKRTCNYTWDMMVLYIRIVTKYMMIRYKYTYTHRVYLFCGTFCLFRHVGRTSWDVTVSLHFLSLLIMAFMVFHDTSNALDIFSYHSPDRFLLTSKLPHMLCDATLFVLLRKAVKTRTR